MQHIHIVLYVHKLICEADQTPTISFSLPLNWRFVLISLKIGIWTRIFVLKCLRYFRPYVLSTDLCYCPCYRPQSYVIVHTAMLLSILSSMLSSMLWSMLSSTELWYCPCYPPQNYVIVHRAMLSMLSSMFSAMSNT